MAKLDGVSDILEDGHTEFDVAKQTIKSALDEKMSGDIPSHGIEGLSVLELLYELYKAAGDEVIGDPNSTFAAYESTGRMVVHTKPGETVQVFSDQSQAMLSVLVCARDEKASFSVCGNQVICILKDVLARGSSYEEAALRALVVHYRKNTPS